MTRDVIIHDIRGRRTCTDADFPLRIGAGADADIRLPEGQASTTFAFVARSESHIFVQPAEEAPPVFHNEQIITDSRWLEHGDVVRIADSSIRFEAGATSIAFVVDAEVVAPPVEPPKEPPPGPSSMPSPADDGAQRAAPRSRPTRHARRRRIVTGVALSLFLALILAAGFVFFATPVAVQVVPAPDRLSIDGTFPGFEVGDRLLLLPGSYRVQAAKAGYRDLDTRVEIAASRQQSFEFALEKLPGLLTFVILPTIPATVTMDGAILGRTPLQDVEIPAGEHHFVVEADRYGPASFDVDVRGLGERQSVDVELTPLWAEVSIASRPAGARVLLDGTFIGETPLDAEIMQGEYRLTLEHAGFDTESTVLRVIANQAQRLPEFTLIESDGLLTVESTPSGATVTVAGRFGGRTPVELSLAPRRQHTLTISKAGYESVERRVSVDPASSDKLAVTLAPRYGTVFITSLPVDAELFVDGRRHGPATGRIRLTTKPHRLEIKKPGYQSFTTTLTPRAGVNQELSVKLVTVAEARAAARKPVITSAEGQLLKLLEPARQFRMGASRREQGRRANESQRLVEITRPYYLGVKEVSNAEFRRFKPDHVSGAAGGNSLNEPTQPVAQVTWENAVRYLNWLSEKDSLAPAYRQQGDSFVPVLPPTSGYRLPTEAEWAYAARYAGHGQARKYPWGEAFPPTGSAGNYADRSASTLLANTLADYVDGYRVSAPVGSFAPSAAGFFDIGGNVAEWCQDFYAVYPNSANRLVKDPSGPASGRHHVVRGSSWRHASISELRLSYRDYSEKPRSDLGFRIARYAD